MSSKGKTLLCLSFQPLPDSVIIGKGKAPRQASGNQRLYAMVQNHLEQYSNATHRRERANIIANIIVTIRERCPAEGGSFIKFDGKRWWQVDETTIRENISAAFRNRLSDRYKSSTKCKSAKRRTLKALSRSKSTTQSPVAPSPTPSSVKKNANDKPSQSSLQPRESAVMTLAMLRSMAVDKPEQDVATPMAKALMISDEEDSFSLSDSSEAETDLPVVIAPTPIGYGMGFTANHHTQARDSILFIMDELTNEPLEAVDPSIFD